MKHPLRPVPWFAFFTFTAFALAAAFHAGASPDMNITKAAWKMLYGVTDTQINDANWLAADSDGDGVSNGDELASGTNPFVAGSSLKVTTVTSDTNNVYLTFTTQLGKLYVLQQTNNLKNGPWTALTPNVQTMGDGTDKTLTAPKGGGNPFFRVLVQDIDSFGDQVSDWAKNVLGMNPSASLSSQSSYTSSTLSSALSTQGIVTVKVTDADATQPPDAVTAANDPAVITIARSGYLLPASITVPLTVSGTAVAGTDYVALPSSVTFPAGVNSIDLVVTPLYNANRTTAATVTVAANPPGSNGSAGNYTVGTPSAAAVNVYPSGAQAGLGLTAEYYLTASSTYTSPINFGGNTVTYTSTATTATVTYNNTNGSFSTGTRANLKFTSGALSGGAFDNIYAITGTSGTTFTVPITGGSTSSGNVVLNAPAVTKLEPNVNFAWGYGTPYTGGLMGPSNFSVAWDGYLSPSVAGTYKFQLDSDKARVFLDTGSGLVQILENGWDTTATGAFKQTASSYTLAIPGTRAARYHFRVEYAHTTGYAKCKLQWSINSGTYVNIPTGAGGQYQNTTNDNTGLVGSYYANTTFTAPVIATQNEAVTASNNGDWGAGGGSPDPVINANNFCARWSGQVLPQYTEPYTFVVNGDDGYRFYLNGVQQQMHEATAQGPTVTYNYSSATNSATINLPATTGLNNGVGDKIPVTFTTGPLSAISGQVVYVITAATSSNFTVSIPPGSYTGTSGNATLNTLNMTYDWGAYISGDRYCTVNLVAGVFYDIKLEYYEASGNASCVLSWYSDDVAKQPIPTSQLFPTITGATPKPGNPPAAPTAITSPSTAIAVVGGGTFNFPLSSSNGGGNYTSTGLPSWLTLNSATGLLSGTPTQAGTYSFTVTVTNAAGSGSQAITITVLANPGNFTRDLFTSGFTGTGVNDVPWLNAPNNTDTSLTSLEDATAYGNNTGERLRGYFTPTTTGNYYFWISANNNAELWISNNAESCNKVRRAVVTGPAGSASRTWNTQTTQKSAWLSLIAGQKYYLEALHNTGAGGASSNLAVGWFLDPTGNTANPIANGAGPSSGVTGGIIPGYVLSPWDNPPTTSVSGSIYITDLSPAAGVNGAKGSGGAFLRVSGSTGLLHLNYSGLTSGATSRRIYAMPVGNNPPTLLFDIDAQDRNYPGLKSSDGAYTWTMQASDLTALNNGTAYLSIATTNNPGGELVGTFGLTTGSQAAPTLPSYQSWTDDHTTDAGASRFLSQATFGPSPDDMTYVKNNGYRAWIENQFTLATTHNVPYILSNLSSDPQNPYPSTLLFNSWWKNAITAPDQLRQRVAFALSEITVVSDTGPLNNNGRILADYYDNLLDFSFDTYRGLLKQVTLTPAMGWYLDMLQNQKGNLQTGLHPNENYAREIMQLFSIGLYHLWPDGTLMLDSTGLPVATYDQTVITGMARVFTGWAWGQALVNGRLPTSLFPASNYLDPMVLVPNYHELGTKILLDNAMLPAATVLLSNDFTQDPNPNPITIYSTNPGGQGNPVQTSITNSWDLNGLRDLENALDSIMNNPALGPFLCRQLIQRMVTSNPKPDYVYRVVRAFNGERNVDGVATGVRGDMKEVIRAILLDYEARSSTAAADVGFGKQREPLLRVTGPVRAFPPTAITGATYRQNGGPNLMMSTASPHRLTSDTVLLNNFVDSGSSTTNLPNIGGYSANAVPTYSHSVFGGNVLYSNTSTTATITAAGYATGNTVYLDFTSGTLSGNASNDNKQFTIASANSTTFTVNLTGSPSSNTNQNCTISVPYSNSGNTATISAPGFTAGRHVYVKFTVGALAGGANDKLYSIDTATTSNFTITLSGSPASGSGDCQTAITSINTTGYQVGDTLPLQFTSTSTSTIPSLSSTAPYNTVQSYPVVDILPTAFTINLGTTAFPTATGNTVTPNNFTTANPAAQTFAYTFSGTAVTLNLSGVPNIAGRQMYVRFTTGSLAGQGFDGLYNITSTDATHVYFTLSSTPTGTAGGNALIPRFTGGYNIINASGTSTIYIQTNVAHSLKVGDPVWIDFLVTNAGTPAVSQAYNVASVGPSPNTFTVTVTPQVSAGSQSTTGQAVYPLAIDTWTRNGTCDVNFGTWNMGYTQSNIIQTPLDSTTVFNFYYPDYHYPGALAAAGMTTPEFQLTNDSNTMNLTNFITQGILNAGNLNGFTSFQGGNGSLVMDMGAYMTQAQTNSTGIPGTVDAIAALLTGGNLNSTTRTNIINYVSNTSNFLYSTPPTNQQMRDRVRAIVHLIITSAEYAIQK